MNMAGLEQRLGSPEDVQETLRNFFVPVSALNIGESSVEQYLRELLPEEIDQYRLVERRLPTSEGEVDAVTLEPVRPPKWNEMSAYWLTELFFDGLFFKHEPWINALNYIASREPDALVLQSALVRTDRPEYKIAEYPSDERDEDGMPVRKRLTHFDQLPEDIRDIFEFGEEPYDPLVEQLSHEFEIVDQRFREVRDRMPEKTEVYYQWSMDDGFTVNRMVHYMALRYKQMLGDEIREISKTQGELKKEAEGVKKDHNKAKEALANAREAKERIEKRLGKVSKLLQGAMLDGSVPAEKIGEYRERSQKAEGQLGKATTEVGGLETEINQQLAEIDRVQAQVDSAQARLDGILKEAEYIRPRKESAFHQVIVNEGTLLVQALYKLACDANDIIFIPSYNETISVNGNGIRTRSNGHSNDAPIKRRARALEDTLAKEARILTQEKGIVLTAEGHQGTYGFMRVDTPVGMDELNGKLEGTFYPPIDSYQQSTFGVLLPVFNDQNVTRSIMSGHEPTRFSGRLPVSNRSHHEINRFVNGAISALFGFHIDEEGRPWRELASYGLLQEEVPTVNQLYALETRSDIHLLNPTTAIELVDGARGRNLRLLGMEEGYELLGIKIVPGALLTVGDDAEGNSHGWAGAGAEYRRPSPFNVLGEAFKLLTGQYDTVDELVDRAAWVLGQNLAGPRENVADLQRLVAEYYCPEFEKLAETSVLDKVGTLVGSNHFFLISRRSGISPHDHLMREAEIKGYDFRLVVDERDARSNAVMLDLGYTTDGGIAFGPIRTIVMHDPDFKVNEGVTAAGVANDVHCQLAVNGHYHMDKDGAERQEGQANEHVLGIAAPSMTRAGSTDIKKLGIPRQKGSKTLYIPAGSTGVRHIFVAGNDALLLRDESYSMRRLQAKEGLFSAMYGGS
jgi:archaellum component FlaC